MSGVGSSFADVVAASYAYALTLLSAATAATTSMLTRLDAHLYLLLLAFLTSVLTAASIYPAADDAAPSSRRRRGPLPFAPVRVMKRNVVAVLLGMSLMMLSLQLHLPLALQQRLQQQSGGSGGAGGGAGIAPFLVAEKTRHRAECAALVQSSANAAAAAAAAATSTTHTPSPLQWLLTRTGWIDPTVITSPSVLSDAVIAQAVSTVKHVTLTRDYAIAEQQWRQSLTLTHTPLAFVSTRAATHTLVFSQVATMAPALPALLFLLYALVVGGGKSHNNNNNKKNSSSSHDDFALCRKLALTIVNVSLVASVVTTYVVRVSGDWHRARTCIHTSDQCMVFALTLTALMFAASHIHTHTFSRARPTSAPRQLLTSSRPFYAYTSWCVLYVVVAGGVLHHKVLRYFHDAVEVDAGVLCALLMLPVVVALTYLLVLSPFQRALPYVVGGEWRRLVTLVRRYAPFLALSMSASSSVVMSLVCCRRGRDRRSVDDSVDNEDEDNIVDDDDDDDEDSDERMPPPPVVTQRRGASRSKSKTTKTTSAASTSSMSKRRSASNNDTPVFAAESNSNSNSKSKSKRQSKSKSDKKSSSKRFLKPSNILSKALMFADDNDEHVDGDDDVVQSPPVVPAAPALPPPPAPARKRSARKPAASKRKTPATPATTSRSKKSKTGARKRRSTSNTQKRNTPAARKKSSQSKTAADAPDDSSSLLEQIRAAKRTMKKVSRKSASSKKRSRKRAAVDAGVMRGGPLLPEALMDTLKQRIDTRRLAIQDTPVTKKKRKAPESSNKSSTRSSTRVTRSVTRSRAKRPKTPQTPEPDSDAEESDEDWD